MTIHTESMLVLSTGHLPEGEAHYLTRAIKEGRVNGMHREEGWLIHTRSLVGAEGFPGLAYLQGYAAALGHEWLLLDNAASLVEQLPVFEW